MLAFQNCGAPGSFQQDKRQIDLKSNSSANGGPASAKDLEKRETPIPKRKIINDAEITPKEDKRDKEEEMDDKTSARTEEQQGEEEVASDKSEQEDKEQEIDQVQPSPREGLSNLYMKYQGKTFYHLEDGYTCMTQAGNLIFTYKGKISFAEDQETAINHGDGCSDEVTLIASPIRHSELTVYIGNEKRIRYQGNLYVYDKNPEFTKDNDMMIFSEIEGRSYYLLEEDYACQKRQGTRGPVEIVDSYKDSLNFNKNGNNNTVSFNGDLCARAQSARSVDLQTESELTFSENLQFLIYQNQRYEYFEKSPF